MYVEKTQTWKDNWNDVIRKVLFKDARLKEQMCLPEGVTIDRFIDKYFIENVNNDEILTDEAVRINYYDSQGRDSGNKNVRNRYKEMDIYVKDNVLHTVSNDYLKHRTVEIAERIKYLLLRNQHVCRLSFHLEDEYNLWTKTPGYRRYHVIFRYCTTV